MLVVFDHDACGVYACDIVCLGMGVHVEYGDA